MKKVVLRVIMSLILIVCVFVCFSCKKKKTTEEKMQTRETVADIMDLEANTKGHKMLVAYFSFTGNTKIVAEKIAETFDIDIIEIEPLVPYEDDILDRDNQDSRAVKEANYNLFDTGETEDTIDYVRSPLGILPEETTASIDNSIKELPGIKKVNVDKYDTIFVGYPIWYGDAPKVIYTFLKDVKNKTIIPFCTADDDTIDMSEQALVNFIDTSNILMSGRKFDVDVNSDTIKEWITRMSADMY